MQITFATGADRLQFFGNYDERIKIVNAELIEDVDYESYYVTFDIPDSYSVGSLAQMFFHAGVSYGLDLKYSSYDNEPSRVR